MSFDHQDKSFNFQQQKERKCVVLSVTRDVIFLPGKYKESLSKQGRVKPLSFKRTMTPQQLQATITRQLECSNVIVQ